jgi:hypothetical protein
MEDQYNYIYDNIINKPIIPKKSYPLNSDYIKKYLSKSDKSDRLYLKKLFEITRHISYRTFKFVLYNNFKELINYCKINGITTISLLLLNIENVEITYKSNFWVAQHFYHYLKNKKVNIKLNFIVDKECLNYIDKNHLILILDDCSYTGDQIKMLLLKSFKILHKKFNVYILIAFITNEAIARITMNIPKNINVILSKNNIIIYDFFHYLTPKERMKINFENKFPIYFDHKLADIFSTYTDIYLGKIINKDIIIPVISNCEYIKEITEDDEWKPPCPISPYKINSADFSKYEDVIKLKSSSKLSRLSSLIAVKSNDNKKIKKKKVKYDKNILVKYKDFISKKK